jgi:hypothetical protein
MKFKKNKETKLNEDQLKSVEKLLEEWAEIFKQHQKRQNNEYSKESRPHGKGK